MVKITCMEAKASFVSNASDVESLKQDAAEHFVSFILFVYVFSRNQ